MDLYLGEEDRRRVTASLYRQLREAIAKHRLRPGDRLPPSRTLAVELGVSRHTVTTVYGRLVAEGFLTGQAGWGTMVTDLAAGAPLEADTRPGGAARPRPSVDGLSAEPIAPVDGIDLRPGLPDRDLFPLDDWRRRVTRALRARRPDLATYGDPLGDRGLRCAIAAWIARSRGVVADPDHVIVTAGAQQAFDLAITAFVEPGDTVAVEDPGYPPFRRLAAIRGAQVVGVPVDDEGLVVDALPDRARLVHVTPSHQFPLGSVMSLRRRRALLAWAATNDGVVIEDDYDTEFRHTGRPLEPMQLLDSGGRVLYVGTFSKTLSPSLRLGFVVAPTSLVHPLGGLRRLLDWHGDTASQRALAGFLDDGTMARHLHRARRAYSQRRDLVLRRSASDLASMGQVVPSAAGLHITLRVNHAGDEGRLITTAARNGIALHGLADYAVTSPRGAGLLIGYGAASLDQLAHAFDVLANIE